MKLISAVIVLGFAVASSAGQITAPSTRPSTPAPSAPVLPAVGEKEFEAALKEYLRVESRESAAAKAQRQSEVIAGLVGRQVNFKGKLGREESKNGKVEVDVVDDSQTRTIVVTKTRDSVTGGKIGKDITIGGEITGVKVDPPELKATGRVKVYSIPRITITVK